MILPRSTKNAGQKPHTVASLTMDLALDYFFALDHADERYLEMAERTLS